MYEKFDRNYDNVRQQEIVCDENGRLTGRPYLWQSGFCIFLQISPSSVPSLWPSSFPPRHRIPRETTWPHSRWRARPYIWKKLFLFWSIPSKPNLHLSHFQRVELTVVDDGEVMTDFGIVVARVPCIVSDDIVVAVTLNAFHFIFVVVLQCSSSKSASYL